MHLRDRYVNLDSMSLTCLAESPNDKNGHCSLENVLASDLAIFTLPPHVYINAKFRGKIPSQRVSDTENASMQWRHNVADTWKVRHPFFIAPLVLPIYFSKYVLNTLRPRHDGVIFQTIFWYAFSWMKMYEFRYRFHWSLLLRVLLTIFQHCFR